MTHTRSTDLICIRLGVQYFVAGDDPRYVALLGLEIPSLGVCPSILHRLYPSLESLR